MAPNQIIGGAMAPLAPPIAPPMVDGKIRRPMFCKVVE